MRVAGAAVVASREPKFVATRLQERYSEWQSTIGYKVGP